MRSLEIHLLVLVLFCALVRMTVGSVPTVTLEMKHFSTHPDLCGQTIWFRDHRFRLAFWSCGGAETVARGRYHQVGNYLYLEDEYSGKQIAYRLSDLSNKPTLNPVNGSKKINGWTLESLVFSGKLDPSPKSVPLTDTPVTISKIGCGMTKQGVKRTLGHPTELKGAYWSYPEGLRIRFDSRDRVIGVAGNELWQGGHRLRIEDREQVRALFGKRLVFPHDGHRGIAAEFGLTILFRYAKKNEDCWLGEMQLGDIPNPGFISNDSGEWPSAEVIEEIERESN